MNRNNSFRVKDLMSVLTLCMCAAFGHCAFSADGVTRSVEPVAGGCKVTLAWEFTGKVESGLVIEERLAQGWTVDDSTVPFGSLDASWFSGNVARFAVKPSLLANPGSISFRVLSGVNSSSGKVAGDWMMYFDGSLNRGAVAGENGLAALSAATGTEGVGSTKEISGAAANAPVIEKAVAIKSFKMLGGVVALSHSGVSKAGTSLAEGCAGRGKPWTEIKRAAVAAGDGSVQLTADEIGVCRFFRMKLLTEE